MKHMTYFVVPVDAKPELTDDGWVFSSSRRIPDSTVTHILRFFKAPLMEEFLGIRKFEDRETQLNVVLGEDNRAMEISIRTALGRTAIQSLRASLSETVKLFDPSK